MPTIVMTPEEFARLPWYARQKILNAQLREQRKGYGVPAEQSSIEWAEALRDEARMLLSAMPIDPDAAAHRQEC